jgi:predicted nuclease of predicted toxin-antitoxin system
LAVWQLARERDCILVTKDEDFHRLSVLRGAPPKVIWLRLGKCTTDEVARLLLRHSIDIEQFGGQVEITVLELG